jgi:hypothetical protein
MEAPMNYEQAVQAGEMVRLKRERAKARKECEQAFYDLQKSKANGTWTEALSAEYWSGPFMRFADLEAQMLGVEPLQQATFDMLTGREG